MAEEGPDFRVGSRVLVEFPNEWLPATCTGFRAADVGEDFQRVDVALDDGRRCHGCHPRHVKSLPKRSPNLTDNDGE